LIPIFDSKVQTFSQLILRGFLTWLIWRICFSKPGTFSPLVWFV